MESVGEQEVGSVGITASDSSFNSDGSAVLSVQFDRKSSFLANVDPKTSTPGRNVPKPAMLDVSLSTYSSSSRTSASAGSDEEDGSTTLNFDSSADPPSSPTMLDTSDILSEGSSPATSPPRNEHRALQQSCIIDPDSIPEIRIEAEPETLYPEDLKVPITGYEVMEERAKFTVFKINVQKSDSESWFVFRRYTDFSFVNDRLKVLFPGIRLSLPPKRWFRSNFDRDFLDDRLHGLQAFLNNITSHGEICNSKPVREFFCFDDPPGPHDSLEESRALCENLEETVYTLRRQSEEKDTEISLLKEELELYRSQVTMLSKHLREVNAGKDNSVLMSPVSNELSIAECDMEVSLEPEADQSHSVTTEDCRTKKTVRETSTPIAAEEKPTPEKRKKHSQVVPVLVHKSGETAS